jgi:serine/threonine protein kinase
MTWGSRELRLVRPLESGDLATVFAAIDVEHGNVSRAVALLHPDLSDVEGIAERMAARIDSSRRVDHPGHVKAEGIYNVSGRVGLVMQLVQGKDVERIAKRAAVPGPVAARIALNVVDVLLAGAEHDLLHGHLGPNRIILDEQGQVRLLGLGMPKGQEIPEDDPFYREERSIRRYAPPEALNGLVTSAVDVYAIGSILTRMISGRWPKRASQLASGQVGVVDAAGHVVEGAGASAGLVALIRDCMNFRADLRPYLKELHGTLETESIDDQGWQHWLP